MALPPSAYPNCPVADPMSDVPFSIQQNNMKKENNPTMPVPHLPPKMPNRKIPPVPLPPSIYRQDGLHGFVRLSSDVTANTQPSIPTPFPYITPQASPFVTAPNTPAFNNGNAFPNHHLSAGQPFIVAQPVAHNAMMANGIPLQHFTFPTVPPPSTQQPNGPINVVVNANANSAADGGDGIGFGADGKKMTICPNCRKGVIIRDQHRSRAVCAESLYVSNHIDQCRACNVVYGKTGGRKPKKVKYA